MKRSSRVVPRQNSSHNTPATGANDQQVCSLLLGVAVQPDSYLDAVVTESLRLRPVIDANERTLTKPRSIAGWDLPAGIRVYPAIVVVQLREDLYPHPHEFRPERFIEEEATSYSWLPFGGGIRRCIGAALAQAEMADVIRTVVSRVNLEPVRPGREPVVMRGVTLVPRHGTPVQVRNRLIGGGGPLRTRSVTT